MSLAADSARMYKVCRVARRIDPSRPIGTKAEKGFRLQ
jgi:hypothetical protein